MILSCLEKITVERDEGDSTEEESVTEDDTR